MCCNSEKSIKKTLDSWDNVIKHKYVLLNNSNDKTEEILKSYDNLTIFKKEFIGFSETRNLLIKLSMSKKFIFIDDSYELLDQELFKRESLSFNSGVGIIRVYTDLVNYPRMLINTKYRYQGKIHETLNCNEKPFVFHSRIRDNTYEEYTQRSLDRVIYDLEQLSQEDQDEPRTIYYTVASFFKLYYLKKITQCQMTELCELSIPKAGQYSKILEKIYKLVKSSK